MDSSKVFSRPDALPHGHKTSFESLLRWEVAVRSMFIGAVAHQRTVRPVAKIEARRSVEDNRSIRIGVEVAQLPAVHDIGHCTRRLDAMDGAAQRLAVGNSWFL